MADDSNSASRDTDRVAVKTYVPAYQREEWDDHADRLDMSRSEFVRSMVQAGRSGFEEPAAGVASSAGPQGSDGENGAPAIDERILSILQTRDHADWENLLDSLTTDFEDRLEDALQSLQDEGRVRYSGRDGGYRLDE
jgi:hypothetical protein